MAAYRFHVHTTRPDFRLVTCDDLPFPSQAAPGDWLLTRTRDETDVNTDVREEIARKGYCLFRIGLSFEEAGF